jgi:hypothetical protein
MEKLLKQNHVTYGLMLCGVLIVCLLLLEITGQTFDTKSPLFVAYQFIAPAVVWYFGINAKKKMQKGKLTWRQGVKEGFKISVVFGIVSPFIFALYYFMNPDILDLVKTLYGNPEVSDSALLIMDLFGQFVSALIFGTLYAAAISFFVKSK